MQKIEAELLVPGHGEPVRDGVVVLDGARIDCARARGAQAPPTPDAAGLAGGHGHAGDVGLPRALPRDQDL